MQTKWRWFLQDPFHSCLCSGYDSDVHNRSKTLLHLQRTTKPSLLSDLHQNSALSCPVPDPGHNHIEIAGRNLFWTLPTIVLVWFMLRGDLGPMLCQPWRIRSQWFLGPDVSRGTAALPCYGFVLNLGKLQCLVLAHFHSWYMYKEIFTERQDGWDWNRPLKVTCSSLLLV